MNLVQIRRAWRNPGRSSHARSLIDLQALLNDVYERSGYDYFINYQIDPLPPLSETDVTWLNALLCEKDLR